MPGRASEPPGVRSPWAWGGALILLGTLGAGLIGAGVLLWQVIDVEPLLVAATEEPPEVDVPVAEVRLPDLPRTPSWHAHLYYSDRSATFFPDSGYYRDLLARWDSLLVGLGATVRTISGSAAVDSLDAEQLLVMPSSVCLNEDEREAVRAYRERGGNLLASWALGARDAACDWLGYDFLRDLAGAEEVGTLEESPPTFLVVPHGAPLAAGFPPGARMELKSEPWIALRSKESAAFWSDWSLNPLPAPGGGYGGAAIAHSNGAGGRFAWFGHRLDVAASERDGLLVERLARNAALWAAGHVLVEVDPWPEGWRAVLAVTQDVEHSFRNSRRLAERFRELGAPVTFFVVSGLAIKNPDLAGELLSAGEVGSHSADHRQIAGRMAGAQLAALSRTRADIAEWSGELPLGLRPPRELFDSLTLEAWRRMGGLYLAASNGARSAAPSIFEVPAGRVVVLPRVVDDDYSVMVMRGENSPDSLKASLLSALEKIRWLGGLQLATVHTQLVDSRRRVSAVESVVEAAREHGDVWITRGADIADWWLARADLEVGLRERADLSALITVRNAGNVNVSGASLHVYLPAVPGSYAAPELGDGVLPAEFTSTGLRIELPALAPGDSLELLLPRRLP